jgi:hypothetical protein
MIDISATLDAFVRYKAGEYEEYPPDCDCTASFDEYLLAIRAYKQHPVYIGTTKSLKTGREAARLVNLLLKPTPGVSDEIKMQAFLTFCLYNKEKSEDE